MIDLQGAHCPEGARLSKLQTAAWPWDDLGVNKPRNDEHKPLLNAIALRVWTHRRTNRVTLSEASRASGVKRMQLHNLEHAKSMPSIATCVAVAQWMGISLDELTRMT